MIRCISIIVLLSATSASVVADPGDSLASRPSGYFFSVRSAALFCNDCNYDGNSVSLLSTVHGINLNKNFAIGAGVGLTSATATWVAPIFGSIRMNVYGKNGQKKNKLFVEFNYGGALTFQNNDNINENVSMQTTCKRYVLPAVGYSIAYHDLRIGIMLGMQTLKMLSVVQYPGYNYSWGLAKKGSPNTTEYGYDAKRFMLGISVGWRD